MSLNNLAKVSSRMDSSDIIEISDDGTFEIPSTPRVNPCLEIRKQSQSVTDHITDDAGRQDSNLIFESIYPGEYKIFHNKSLGTMHVMLCLRDEEVLKVLQVSKTTLLVIMDGDSRLNIVLPVPIDSHSAISKSFGKYIIVQCKCA